MFARVLAAPLPHANQRSSCSQVLSLRKKCPYSEFFWSVFSRIQTEYGEIRSISPYSVRVRENTDQKNSEYGHFSRSAYQRAVQNISQYLQINIYAGVSLSGLSFRSIIRSVMHMVS